MAVLVIDHKLKYKIDNSCCFIERKSKLLINYPSSFLLKCARNIPLIIDVVAATDDDNVDPTHFNWIRALNNSNSSVTRTTIITEQ